MFLPNGSEFTTKVIDLQKLLELVEDNKGNSKIFLEKLANLFFIRNGKPNKSLASNCRSALKAYGIIEKGKIEFTEFGEELYKVRKKKSDLYDMLAKHILLNLNGLLLLDSITDLRSMGKKITLENISDDLNFKTGSNINSSGKRVPTMKSWLVAAGIIDDKWNIDFSVYKKFVSLSKADLLNLRMLNDKQKYFLLSMNTLIVNGVKTPMDSKKVRDLASKAYHIQYSTKQFSNNVLNPLEKHGLVKVDKRKGKSALVSQTAKFKMEVTVPYLKQLRDIHSPELVKYFLKSFSDILKNMNSKDTHVKGLALEALAYKLISLINLDYVKTRLRSNQTGGAEVDLLFESTSLSYSRWQIQCKNTKVVKLEDVAKEVGLTLLLKSNIVLMVGNGKISSEATRYATTIMKESNLQIIFINGDDLKKIADNPTHIVDILDLEALKAKRIKDLSSRG